MREKPRPLLTATVENAPRAFYTETVVTSGAGTVSFGPMNAIAFNDNLPWAFEIWFYADTLLDSMNLISRQGEFVLQTRNDTLFVQVTGLGGGITTPSILEPGNWYHVAVTSDGFTISLYVDGDRVAFQTPAGSGPEPTGNPLTIGGGFYGQIDSARCWNAPLANGLIYEYQFVDYPSGTAGLVAQIDFTQSPPVDTSGNDTPIKVSRGVELETFTPAVAFVEEGFCDPYDDESINPAGTPNDFSIMAWIAPSYLGGTQVIFANGPDGGGGMSLAVGAAGKVVFRIGSATLQSDAMLAENTWTNVAATWTASSGAAALYIDGNSNATGTLAFGSGLAEGAPLLGAGVSSDGTPESNFYGYIQSVSLWRSVLSQDDVQSYMTLAPIKDANCIADYDFSVPRPMNNITANEIGLVGGAQLVTLVSTPPVLPARGRGRTVRARREGGFAPRNLKPADYAPERRAELVAGFREFMTSTLHLSADAQERYARLMEENLDRAGRDLEAGTYRRTHYFTIERRPDGTGTMTLHTQFGSFVVHDGALDPCTTWAIGFIWSVLMAIVSVLGFAAANTQAGARFVSYMSARLAPILTKLKAAFAGAGSSGPTTQMIWKMMKVLWDHDLLGPLMSFAWEAIHQSISWWTIMRIGARMALWFSPWAAAEVALFLAELAYDLWQLVDDWNDPNNCWKSSTGAPLIRAA